MALFGAAARDSLYLQVLQRYPDCPELPPLPPRAEQWSEGDFEVFISSMGQIVPSGQSVEPTDVEESTPPHAAGEHAGAAHVKGLGSAEACLVIPSQIFMEDRAPAGLNLESVLTKFDRCRAAALQTICATNLREMADGFGVGILLTDLNIFVESPTPPALISSANVESEIDLPRLPMVPSRQRLIGDGGGVACSASFGQVLVDLKTTRLSGNQEAYRRLQAPCDRIFGRDVPNAATLAVRGALATKLAQQYPAQGRSFTPEKYFRGRYFIAPSDCDVYNTLYHPKVPSVCEHACLSTGERFCCDVATAFLSRFLSPLPPGMPLVVHMLVETEGARGTRCLYLFEEEGKEGACVLCAFAVYGGPIPGVMYQEEAEACSQKSAQWFLRMVGKFSMVEAVAAASIAAAAAADYDLSKLVAPGEGQQHAPRSAAFDVGSVH